MAIVVAYSRVLNAVKMSSKLSTRVIWPHFFKRYLLWNGYFIKSKGKSVGTKNRLIQSIYMKKTTRLFERNKLHVYGICFMVILHVMFQIPFAMFGCRFSLHITNINFHYCNETVEYDVGKRKRPSSGACRCFHKSILHERWDSY